MVHISLCIVDYTKSMQISVKCPEYCLTYCRYSVNSYDYASLCRFSRLVVSVFFLEFLLKWLLIWVGAWCCYIGNVPTHIIIQYILKRLVMHFVRQILIKIAKHGVFSVWFVILFYFFFWFVILNLDFFSVYLKNRKLNFRINLFAFG